MGPKKLFGLLETNNIFVQPKRMLVLSKIKYFGLSIINECKGKWEIILASHELDRKSVV